MRPYLEFPHRIAFQNTAYDHPISAQSRLRASLSRTPIPQKKDGAAGRMQEPTQSGTPSSARNTAGQHVSSENRPCPPLTQQRRLTGSPGPNCPGRIPYRPASCAPPRSSSSPAPISPPPPSSGEPSTGRRDRTRQGSQEAEGSRESEQRLKERGKRGQRQRERARKESSWRGGRSKRSHGLQPRRPPSSLPPVGARRETRHNPGAEGGGGVVAAVEWGDQGDDAARGGNRSPVLSHRAISLLPHALSLMYPTSSLLLSHSLS